MFNLELKEVVLDSCEIHVNSLAPEILTNCGKWEVCGCLTAVTGQLAVHRVVSDPRSMVDRIQHTAFTSLGVFNSEFAVTHLALKSMRSRLYCRDTIRFD